MSDMTPFMSVSVLQCAVYTDGSYTNGFTGGYKTLEPYTVCGTPFQVSGNASDIRNLFMRLGLAVLQKHLMDDCR